jgi:hypothetical protein
MPSSYSTNLRFELQFTGENINLWGNKLNDTFARVDDSIAGFVALAITGDYSLQSANTNSSADEARRAHLKFTGTLVSSATITLPSVSKSYQIWNASGQTLTFTTGAGNTYAIENGDIAPIWCDGANVKGITYGGYALKAFIAASVLGATGSLPATAGNAGKFVYTDGASSYWKAVTGADLASWTASSSVVRTGTSVALAMTPGDTYGSLAEVTLTSTAGSVALDFGAMVNGYHDLTENTTLANPTNAKVGQSGWIRVRQHASSAKTCATGTNWYRVGGDLAVSTTLSGYNIYEYQVLATDYILYDLLRDPSNA